jgi:hypothetical protein
MTIFRRTRCPHCKAKLDQGQRIHAECIEPYADAEEAKAKRKAEKQARMQARVERAKDKQAKEAQKGIRELLAEAQKPFNEFIRLRDADLPCISCGAVNPPMKPGGQWDAGHFLGRGAFPELRFEELNCHKQCKVCNAGSGKFAHKERTVREKYEANLPDRIGQAAFDWLMGPHDRPKWTRDQALAIKATYTQKLKDLKKEREA